MRPVVVTDHAVLRYLERIGGFDIEGLRRQIADRLSKSALPGAQSVNIDGYRYVLRDADGTSVVTTVLDKHWLPTDHHQREAQKIKPTEAGA